MKKYILIILSTVFLVSIYSFSIKNEANNKTINFTIRGNGKSLVEIGIGSSIGYGSCCRGVSEQSYVGFQGNEGDVVWDSKTKRVIIKVYSGLEGKTVDLREYYWFLVAYYVADK